MTRRRNSPVKLYAGAADYSGTVSLTCETTACITARLEGLFAAMGATLKRVVAMRKLKILAAAVLLFAAVTPSLAQDYGRPQDGFSSGQYSGQYSSQFSDQYNGRVDGRANHNEGLPPSAADKGNRTFDNPIDPRDCAEVDSLRPDARPGWQARVRSACE
jgi:hypothetical protein